MGTTEYGPASERPRESNEVDSAYCGVDLAITDSRSIVHLRFATGGLIILNEFRHHATLPPGWTADTTALRDLVEKAHRYLLDDDRASLFAFQQALSRADVALARAKEVLGG